MLFPMSFPLTPQNSHDEVIVGGTTPHMAQKISNALKRLGFRSHNLLAQPLSENLKSMYHPGSTIKFREALE
jgi:hypothetical protein